jgi:glyoxylase-like metal-dependent hydrolase (beta-lactamase superfamily II)
MSGNYQFRRVWNVDNAYARSIAKDGWSNDYYSSVVTPDSWNPTVPVPARYDDETAYSRPYRVTRWVRPGDRIDLGGRVLRIVASPGHSPDGISLLDRAQGLLFVGDVFYNSDLYVFLDGSSLSRYTITARLLARLTSKVRRILPSHNVTMISSNWLTRMDEAFQAIRHGTAADYTDYVDYGIRVYDFGYFRIDVRLSDVTS